MRTKKQKTFAPPGWRQAIKAKFLSSAFHHNPRALYLLVTKAKTGEITTNEWARTFNVAGTWIEDWAEDALQLWRVEPYRFNVAPVPNGTATGNVEYPPPRDEETKADVFSFSVSGTPRCRLLVGITIGGSLRQAEPLDDWTRFRTQMHERLDLALEQHRENAVLLGASQQVIVPADLDLKLEVAAVYVFCSKSAEELGKHVAVLRDRTVVSRWLRQILELLDLPMKKRGHQRPKSTA